MGPLWHCKAAGTLEEAWSNRQPVCCRNSMPIGRSFRRNGVEGRDIRRLLGQRDTNQTAAFTPAIAQYFETKRTDVGRSYTMLKGRVGATELRTPLEPIAWALGFACSNHYAKLP
jgi:hypothetical protein